MTSTTQPPPAAPLATPAAPDSDPPAQGAPLADQGLSRLLMHFDLATLLLSVVGLSAAGVAAVLVVRQGGLSGWNALIVGLLLLTAASVVAYYVLVTLARQRLHDRLALMRDAAHELGGGDLSVAVPEGDDDLGALGASLNTMRSRVARLMTAQRELLSGVSHELRSPLARIEVAMELIDMELAGDEEHELIIGVREEVALLERHISRLLEAQRVTRDRIVLTRRALVVDTLLAQVIARERLRLQKLGWRLDVKLDAGDHEILGDENALDRVFSTLIENAIRHAASPGPEAAYSGAFEAVQVTEPPPDTESDSTAVVATPDSAELAADDSPPGQAVTWRPSLRIETEISELGLLVRFLDRGPGLGPEQCTRVFEPFFRGDQSRSTATGGTGLGMYLTRNILRAHGGDVLARPRDGGGLMVELCLPLRTTKVLKETMRVQWADVRDDV